MADLSTLSPGDRDPANHNTKIRQTIQRVLEVQATANSAVQPPIQTASIGDNQVTYAKIQDISATSRILGRKTAGAGDPEECTLSQVLDFVGSAANGDILYRSGGAWVRLPIGSNTNILTVASSLPSWAAAATASQPTRQYLTSGTAATYTTPANCKLIIIKMIAGGGGGGAATTNAGATGTNSLFNGIQANPGNGGPPLTGIAGTGGTAGGGAASLRLPGSGGGSNTGSHSGNGAAGLFGMGGGPGRSTDGAGQAAGANTGAGGGGAKSGTNTGNGGGSGEYVEIVIPSPVANYTYTVGAGGAGGAAGLQAGGNGGSGLIIVEEYY